MFMKYSGYSPLYTRAPRGAYFFHCCLDLLKLHSLDIKMTTEKRIKILAGSEVLEFYSTPIFTANDQRFFFALDDRETRGIELKNCHGLRHAYAQTRYKELTGLEAPINGGPAKKQRSTRQKNHF